MPKTEIIKVTAFIICKTKNGHDLLLFQHPHAGIQIPAGTAKDGETPQQAIMREAAEETGLTGLRLLSHLGGTEEKAFEGYRLIGRPTKVYARPDLNSFDWAHLRRGVLVVVNRQAEGFSQVTFEEHDQMPDPQYVTMRIMGWVPDDVLCDWQTRHFFLLEFGGQSEPSWTTQTDNHVFTLFWAPLADLPAITAPQDQWLQFLRVE